MKIRQIKEKDAKELSRMHIAALPETTSSKIGLFYLENIYKTIARCKTHNHAFIAVDNGKILGIIAATTNLSLFQSQLRKNFSIIDYIKILFSIITLKISPFEILKRIQFEKNLILHYKNNYATIIILFVNRKYRKRGIGSQLIKKILKIYRYKVKYIYIDTKLENMEAARLYMSLGFIKVNIIGNSRLMLFNNTQK